MFNLPFIKRKVNIKPTVLVILDGFGVAPPSGGNAITLAKTPNYDSYVRTYPYTELIASGESVGLPANEVGNTEVGHLTMGAGRTILQDLKRINQAIENGTFYDNKGLVAAANHAKSHNVITTTYAFDKIILFNLSPLKSMVFLNTQYKSC